MRKSIWPGRSLLPRGGQRAFEAIALGKGLGQACGNSHYEAELLGTFSGKVAVTFFSIYIP